MYFVLHHITKHIMKHIMPGRSTVSDAELDYLVTVVTTRALLYEDLLFPLLLANNLEVGGGYYFGTMQMQIFCSPKIFHLMTLASNDDLC